MAEYLSVHKGFIYIDGTNKEDIMRVQIEETIHDDILKPHNIKPLSLFFLEKVDACIYKKLF